MRLLLLIAVSTAFVASSISSTAAYGEESTNRQIERVETSLPAVLKDNQTLDLSLKIWMEALGIPGVSVAVIDDYRIAWASGFGVMEAGEVDRPISEETIFQAASIAKPVAALAVLHHVEQGTFQLDTDINSYLKSWQLPASSHLDADVTLRQLLAHTGGVTPGGFAGYERGTEIPNTVQILAGQSPATNSAAQVVSSPGSAVQYSGLGYTLVELALTDSLGKPFDDIVREAVFQPVGMQDSTFEQVLPDDLAGRAASGHRSTGSPIASGWYLSPELAAAGLWTTPTDLALLAIEIAKSKSGRSNQILSRSMTQRMLTPHKEQMGIGLVVRPENEHGYFAHSGGNQGYRAHFEMLADTGDGVVVMTNSDAGHLIAALLIRSVAQAYNWPSQPRPVSAALTEAIFNQLDLAGTKRAKIEVGDDILAKYVGQYELAPGLEFDVTLEQGQLLVQLGDQPPFPIYPESKSKFFLEVVDAQITFTEDSSGNVVSLILHQGGRDQEALKIK